MDLDKILKKYKGPILERIKKNSPDHISTENILKFVYNEFDINKKKDEIEYNKIVEHLIHCNECNEEIQLLKEMIENEKEKLSHKESDLTEEMYNQALTEFKNRIRDIENQEKAKKLARTFISEYYPKLKADFQSAWKAILEIPEGAKLVLTKKQLPGLAFSNTKKGADQLLLFKILFTVKSIFNEIDKNSDIEQINSIINKNSKQNNLSKKVVKQLITLNFKPF